jgi:ribonuclease HII
MLYCREEEGLRAAGCERVAGIDEAGRGSLAGPVVAGAVILPPRLVLAWMDEVRDSKLLTAPRRERLFERIREVALAVGAGVVSHRVIETKGIVKATRLAMRAAVQQLDPAPEYLLIDYMKLPEVRLPQRGVVNGDSLCLSIACASIIAKVTRDRLMVEMDGKYPGYGLAKHKGYGTRSHIECLRRLGPCPIHRRTFQPVTGIISQRRLCLW